jgi:hypothetical protein
VDPATLLWGIVFGSFGMGYFIYGKKQERVVALLCGVVLMALPYLIDNVFGLVASGVLLLALPWFVRR